MRRIEYVENDVKEVRVKEVRVKDLGINLRRIEYVENGVKKVRVKGLGIDKEFTEEEYKLFEELIKKLELVRLLLRLKDKLQITDEELALLTTILR